MKRVRKSLMAIVLAGVVCLALFVSLWLIASSVDDKDKDRGWVTKWHGKETETVSIADMAGGSIGVGLVKEENGVVEIDIYDTYYDAYECRIIAISKWRGKTYTGKLTSEIKPDKGARFNKAKFEDISLKKIKEFRFQIRPQSDRPTQPGIAWGQPVGGVQLGIDFDLGDRQYRTGELVTFKVYVRNTGDKEVKFIHYVPVGDPARERVYLLAWSPSITDVTGKRLPLFDPLRNFHAQRRQLRLPPGTTSLVGIVSLQLTSRLDERPDEKSSDPHIYLEPGQYRVSQTYRFDEAPEATWHGELTTGELRLSVQYEQPATQPGEEWGRPVQGVRSRLHAAKPIWKVGEIPALILEVQNQSEMPWAVRPPEAEGRPQVQVDGVWYERTRSEFSGYRRGMVTRVQPGGTSQEINLVLNNAWRSRKDGQRLSLFPGKHLIRATFKADQFPPGEDAGKSPILITGADQVQVVSNPLEIEILADGWDPTQAILAINHWDGLRRLLSEVDPERLQQRYAQMVTHDNVLKNALQGLRHTSWYETHSRTGPNILEELRRVIQVRPGPRTGLLTITVTGSDKDELAEIANVIAQAAVDNAVVPDVPEFRQEIERLQQELKTLETRVKSAEDSDRKAAKEQICELRIQLLPLMLFLHRRPFSIRLPAAPHLANPTSISLEHAQSASAMSNPVDIEIQPATQSESNWLRRIKKPEDRGTLQDIYEQIRQPQRRSKVDELWVVPGGPHILEFHREGRLDQWLDALAIKKLKGFSSEDDVWLLFRSKQLNDNDRMWIERIEKKADQIVVLTHRALWRGEYKKNATWYPIFGVNLGKLPAGNYRANWTILPYHFTEFDAKGWPRGAKLTEEKPTELNAAFTVEPSPGAAAQADEEWGKPVEGVQVRLRADKKVWKAGEFPIVKADVRNTGRRDLYLPYCYFQAEVEVDGSLYRHTGPSNILRPDHGPYVKHREDIEIYLYLRCWTAVNNLRQELRLKPGRNMIRVAFYAEPDNGQRIRVVSNPVEIEIQPATQPAEEKDKLVWGVVGDGIQCAVRPVKPSFAPNEDIVADVMYQNVSNDTITVCVYPDPYYTWLHLYVRDPVNGMIVMVGQHANGIRRPLRLSDFVRLRPGQTASFRQVIAHSKKSQPEPGSYFLQAEINKINRMDVHLLGLEEFCKTNGIPKPWCRGIESGKTPVMIATQPPE